MVELYEENIEEWYKKKRDTVSLTEYLCERSGILKDNEKDCLYEVFDETKKSESNESNSKVDPEKESEDAKKIQEAIARQSGKTNSEL